MATQARCLVPASLIYRDIRVPDARRLYPGSRRATIIVRCFRQKEQRKLLVWTSIGPFSEKAGLVRRRGSYWRKADIR